MFTLRFWEVELWTVWVRRMSRTLRLRQIRLVIVRSNPDLETLAGGSLRDTWANSWFRVANFSLPSLWRLR